MSKEEYDARMAAIKAKNANKERKNKLKEEKRKYRTKFKLPSTSKLILLGVMLLCLEIVIFCEYTMLALQDVSAMYVLIGIPAALVPIVWGYYSKSKAENTAGGIIYETAMKEKEQLSECIEDVIEEEVMG